MEAASKFAWRGGAGIAEAIRTRPVLTRWLLAGPGALLAAVATMAAMALWVPAGAAGVNDIAFPVVLAPLIWAAFFFYACLDADLVRAVLVLTAAIVVQGGVALAMAG